MEHRSEHATEPPRVLVVDDEEDISETVRFCLEQEDYEVRTASNGQEALSIVHEWTPRLVLLDVMMPGENGYRVSRTIKDDVDRKVLPPVHVVLVTARRLEGEREHIFARFSRADGVLYKPFDLDDLVGVVARACGRTLPVGAPG